MTFTILGQLNQKVRDALDGARAAGAALARSAHEVVENSHAEPTPTAEGTSGRARLIDSETVRVLLTAANLARLDGQLAAYGVVLRLLDEVREAEHATARARVQAEAETDARLYLENAEDDPADEYARGAFDATIEEDGQEWIAPLTIEEARDCYVASFLRVVREGGAS
jgi:hypothetical protein